ncbi:MAG: sugar-binding protein [Bacteroidales bacterium]|nr:sugar-binding protein [Bacteroidales bacterium]
MKNKSLSKFLYKTFIIIFVILFGKTTNATDYWVSSSGGLNTNPGTQAYPFQTISKAASVVTEGGTVHVAPGTYQENIYTTTDGTVSARIVFVSDTKWGAKIIPPTSSSKSTGFDNRGDYVTIDGFEVDGTIDPVSGTKWTVGINVGGEGDIVKNCLVHHIYNTGVANSGGGAGILLDAWYGFNNMQALGNVVHHVGPTSGGSSWYHGIYQTATGSIKNNITYAIAGGGIHMWHDANHITIANNTSFGNGAGFLFGGGDYVHTTGPADYCTFANNIAFDNTGIGFDQEGDYGTHNIWTNNLSYQNGTNWRLNGNPPHTFDVTANPQFVNYIRTGGGDYHLKSISPAIDAGTSTYAPSTDFDGNTRPQGTGYDIGAYEYILSSPTLTVNPSSLAFGNVLVNSTSAEKTYALTGSNLTANVTVTAPAGYEVSKTTGTGFASSVTVTQSSGNVNQTVYVRFKPTAVQAYNGNVTNASTGATTQNVALTGSGVMNLIAKKTLTQINIDGNINDCGWNNARSVTFTNSNRSDNTITVHTLWDNNYFYISYEITDINVENPSGVSIHLQDAIELYIDAGHEKSASIDATDYQYIINAEDSIYYNHAAIGTQISHKTLSVVNGYNVEIAIPWGQINTTPVAGKTFGIDFCNDDRDNSISNTFDWMDLIAGGNYKLPNLWGDVILSDTTVCTSTNVDLKTELNNVNIYPNPFTVYSTLKISSATILKNAMIKIYDVCGKEVKTILINDNETIIDREELINGIYFYSIINNNETINKGKLVIQ